MRKKFYLYNDRCIVGMYIFLCKYFLLYSVAEVDAVSNMCDICLLMVFYGLPHAFSIIYELLINTLANFSENHKSTHLNMRSKMEQRLFACDHSTQQSSVGIHRINIESKGDGWQWTWE